MKILTIESKQKTKRGKTRAFSATMLGCVVADPLWPGGQTATNATRPVYTVIAGTEASLRPFLANVRKGRKAALRDSESRGWSRSPNWYEWLKTAGYSYLWQRGRQYHTVTVFLPGLFQVDPGMIDPERCEFLSMPPLWWVEKQSAVIRENTAVRRQVLDHARRLRLGETQNALSIPPLDEATIMQFAPLAAHFVMMLDRRTRKPIIGNLGFCLQLYLAALKSGLATFNKDADRSPHLSFGYHLNYRNEDMFMAVERERVGLAMPVMFRAAQADVDALLTGQIRLYRSVGGK